MLTEFSLYNESEMRQWDKFVESHPKGTPFHLSCWIRTIHETYAFTPFLYIEKDVDENISGILPCFLVKNFLTGSRIVSLPFSDYGGPLLRVLDQESQLLREVIKKNGNHIASIEIRSSLSENSGLIPRNYYKRHVLDLSSGLSELKKNIDKRTILYSIRKAEKAGVHIKEENTEWGIKEFYRLNLLTRKKHGIPSQPLRFFQKLYDYMVSKGHASIVVAISDSKTIAAGIFLKFKDAIYYKYNASDPKLLSTQTPNHLLTWHAIEQASSHGYRFFDFGRTSPDNEGLMRYKKMWSANTIDLPYYYYPRIKGLSSEEEKSLFYRIVTSIWRFLPNTATDKIGPKMYKYMS
jgi:hypothetical protein